MTEFSRRGRAAAGSEFLVVLSVLFVLVAACGWREWGTSGTAIEIQNSCSEPLLLRLVGERWSRSVDDQLKGTVAESGSTVRETAIHPPDENEQLVLRASPVSGDPMLVVAIGRDEFEDLVIGSSACNAVFEGMDCVPVVEGVPPTVRCG